MFTKRFGKIPARIYIRQCYLEMYDLLVGTMIEEVPVSLVTGVPGIGKSMFCLYFLVRLMTEQKIGGKFLCQFGKETKYLFEPTGNANEYKWTIDVPFNAFVCY